MDKITPCLWFDGNAEEAAKFYCSIFKRSKIGKIMRNVEGGPGPKGSVLALEFTLDGRLFMGLNGGPEYKMTPAISFSVDCKDQKEVDYYWSKLLAGGGQEVQCGWLTDKFGVSWQIVPRELPNQLRGKDPKKVKRVMDAMMKMVKIDVAGIKRAAKG